MARTEYRPDSNYRTTNIIDNKYLDIYQDVISNKSEVVTKTITVDPKYDLRPDVLANDLYSNPKLWWVFAEFNPDTLVDPILDLKSGMSLIVPEKFS
jgi:hypothetical protein